MTFSSQAPQAGWTPRAWYRRYRGWRENRKRLRRMLELIAAETNAAAGFHEDRYVLALADFFLRRSGAFVETGTLAGTTTRYVGERYRLPVFACDPSPTSYAHTVERCRALDNVEIVQQASPEFLYGLLARRPELKQNPITFWLDAHGYGFRWPLREEIEFLTREVPSAFLMIDDFEVPGRPEFGYDEFDGQACSLAYIETALARREYKIIYPAYAEATSPRDPLRGVGVLVYGIADFELPPDLRDSFDVEDLTPGT